MAQDTLAKETAEFEERAAKLRETIKLEKLRKEELSIEHELTRLNPIAWFIKFLKGGEDNGIK